MSSPSPGDVVTRWTLLYYKYVKLSDAQRPPLAAWFKTSASTHGLVGRVLVGRDGVNATLGATSRASLEAHSASLSSLPGFSGIDFKIAPSFGPRNAAAVSGCHFDQFQVRVRDEMLAMNVPPGVADPANAGTHLSPFDFHAALVRSGQTGTSSSVGVGSSARAAVGAAETVLIDVRNGYEHAIGRFEPPPGVKLFLPPVRTFSEFPAYFDSIQDELRGKTVLMYCTGGVRCERASAYVREKGDGFSDVFQLDGGIQRYMEAFAATSGESPLPLPIGGTSSFSPSLSVPSSSWVGSLFVFDERPPVRSPLPTASSSPSSSSSSPAIVSLGGGDEASTRILGRCLLCGSAHERYSWLRCGRCRVLVLVCDACAGSDVVQSLDGGAERGLRCAECANGRARRAGPVKTEENARAKTAAKAADRLLRGHARRDRNHAVAAAAAAAALGDTAAEMRHQ
jgi:predicted sulfurtransferase